jgi:ATP-binding cassette subfamily G (WHITE) protein 2 (SNQ2)
MNQYWGVGFPTGFTAGYMFLMTCMFELFYIGFGQAIASFSANELLASLFVPFFFLFVVAFCGVVVPYAALPTFWRSWMYWLTPFHYLLEGFLAAITHGVPVICDSNEFARFSPPPGQTCLSYTDQFVAQAGGYVQTGADGLCEFCQYANGDQFAASFNVFYSNIWRDYGLMWAYCIFNFGVVFLCSWLYLGGARKIRKAFSPKARKQAKMAKSSSDGTV